MGKKDKFVSDVCLDVESKKYEKLCSETLAVPDTGATHTIFPSECFPRDFLRIAKNKWKNKKNKPNAPKIVSATSKTIKIDARVKVWLITPKKRILTNILISPKISKPLICYRDLLDLGFLQQSFPINRVTEVKKTNVSADKNNEEDKISKRVNKLLDKYPKVFQEAEFEPMKFPALKLVLDPKKEIVPYHSMVARKYPVNLEEAALKELRRLEKLGVIAKVIEPSEWCAPSFFIPKPNGDVRLIADFSKLSQQILRPVHPFPSSHEIIRSIKPGMKYFCSIDARQGYFQLKLDKSSQHLTTFLTPHGRYKFLRLPMGLSSSGDHWCLASDAALEGLKNVEKLVDDILCYGETLEELLLTLEAVLKRCDEYGIKCTRKKIQYGTSITFAGFKLSGAGAEPCPEKLKAISGFPRPANLTDLRSFLGLAQQLSVGVPDLAHASNGLRQLLKKDVAFVWTNAQEESFLAVKKIILSPRVVSFYDKNLETEVLADASRIGLGYALTQRRPDGSLTLIQCSSRSLTDAEKRYSVSELEMLAIVFAIRDAKHFLQHAPPFTVISDHRPLLGVFSKHLGDITNPRLQRLREKIIEYPIKLVWQPGKIHFLADAISRNPVFPPTTEEIAESDDLKHVNLNINKHYKIQRVYNVSEKSKPNDNDLLLKELKSFCQKDPTYKVLVKAIKSLDSASDINPSSPIRPYKKIYNQLSLDNGFVLFGDLIVIPKNYINKILTNLHLGHMGMSKTIKLARTLYWWPGMDNDIKTMVATCSLCFSLLPKKPVDKVNHNIDKAKKPMDILALDLFHNDGKTYLVIVDQFSSYFFVFLLRLLNTKAVLKHFLETQLRYGFCALVIHDGGPQFISEEWLTFCENNNIIDRVTASYHGKSNGLAESSVKRAKFLLKKTTPAEFNIHLLAYLNAPMAHTDKSPAELFFQRQFRIPGRPTLHHALLIDEDPEESPFRKGDNIWVLNPHTTKWSIPGKITGIRKGGHSFYIFNEESEKVIIRNENHIRLRRKSARSPT